MRVQEKELYIDSDPLQTEAELPRWRGTQIERCPAAGLIQSLYVAGGTGGTYMDDEMEDEETMYRATGGLKDRSEGLGELFLGRNRE
jgi:hypothetical protein